MRLSSMSLSLPRTLLAAASLLLVLPAAAQQSVPPNSGSTFKDTSVVKPPAGAKVAIYEFEDLECPACARAFPIVHAAVEHYKIPLVRHDFPLKMHIWSHDAAVIARYIQDKISPSAAEDYRRAVFASQTSIASKEDLQNFTRRFFQNNGRTLPFVVDPTGQFAKEVDADYALGERVGLTQTPTIFVVTQKQWIQVTDPTQIYQTLDTVIAQTGGTEHAAAKAPANSKLRHASTPQK